MHAIQEKLSYLLISLMLAIGLGFIFLIIGLYYFGIVLTLEAYAQIFAAIATLLAVILTLGLRLVDDTIHRYERFAVGRITNLKHTSDSILKELPVMEQLTLETVYKALKCPIVL
jgi:hypothetical protein